MPLNASLAAVGTLRGLSVAKEPKSHGTPPWTLFWTSAPTGIPVQHLPSLTVHKKSVFLSHGLENSIFEHGAKGHRQASAQSPGCCRIPHVTTELEAIGPVLPSSPHYGKISGRPGCHHCHILRGRPTYVAVWRENIQKNEIEVLYVGSHESANYRRIC